MSEVDREAGLQSRRAHDAHDANARASMSEVEREAQNLARSQRRRSRQTLRQEKNGIYC